MQGGGFLLATLSPWLAAVLHDATGSCGAGWIMHLAFVTLVFALTARLAPDGYAAVMAVANKPGAATLNVNAKRSGAAPRHRWPVAFHAQ